MKSFVREIVVRNSGRLDRVLRAEITGDLCFLSRNSWKWLFSEGRVTDHNGRRLKPGLSAVAGTVVNLELPCAELGLLPYFLEKQRSDQQPLAGAVLKTSEFLLWNKNSGIPTLPHWPWEANAVNNQILSHLQETSPIEAEAYLSLLEPPKLDAGLVQRLDHWTSGLLLAALNEPAKIRFQKKIQAKAITKDYFAIVSGLPSLGDLAERMMTLAFAICPLQDGKTLAHDLRHSIAFAEEAKRTQNSYTTVDLAFKIESRSEQNALVRVRTNSGQRHIVRATLGALGAPLYGDVQYQTNAQRMREDELRSTLRQQVSPELAEELATGFFLHAGRLEWFDADRRHEYSVTPPTRFLQACEILQLDTTAVNFEAS